MGILGKPSDHPTPKSLTNQDEKICTLLQLLVTGFVQQLFIVDPVTNKTTLAKHRRDH
jgi:hypothetical protein